MTLLSIYPPSWTVDTETGEVVGTAMNLPADWMSPPTHQVTIRLTGTVTIAPLNQEG